MSGGLVIRSMEQVPRIKCARGVHHVDERQWRVGEDVARINFGKLETQLQPATSRHMILLAPLLHGHGHHRPVIPQSRVISSSRPPLTPTAPTISGWARASLNYYQPGDIDWTISG